MNYNAVSVRGKAAPIPTWSVQARPAEPFIKFDRTIFIARIRLEMVFIEKKKGGKLFA